VLSQRQQRSGNEPVWQKQGNEQVTNLRDRSGLRKLQTCATDDDLLAVRFRNSFNHRLVRGSYLLMSSYQQSSLESFLHQHDDAAWLQVIEKLLPAIHPVDQRGVRIWFAFYPLTLKAALESAAEPEKMVTDLILKGKYRLADQVDSSAEFLYGHRYWPAVKTAIAEYATTFKAASGRSLADIAGEIAALVAAKTGADKSLLTGMAAVGLMTLQHVGLDLMQRPAQVRNIAKSVSPEKVLWDRVTDDRPGLFGFLRSVDQRFTVTFNESDPEAKFAATNTQDVAMAAAADKRPHHLRDARCREGEGVIPVECRTAACGTCWVGVLSDASKVSAPNAREIEKMNEVFCYPGFTDKADSPIRLACQMRCHGNVSIVIPPWNGLLRKLSHQPRAEETVASST
jgi:ferredoxin